MIVSWACELVAPISAVSSGRAGRYVSMVSGPIALSAPRTRTSRTYRLPTKRSARAGSEGRRACSAIVVMIILP